MTLPRATVRRAVVRALTIPWLLLSALLPSALAVLDAGVEASATTVASHVEQEGGTGCPEVHDTDCALCSTLRTARRDAPAAIDVPSAARTLGAAQSRSLTQFRSAEAVGAARPRGPPVTA